MRRSRGLRGKWGNAGGTRQETQPSGRSRTGKLELAADPEVPPAASA